MIGDHWVKSSFLKSTGAGNVYVLAFEQPTLTTSKKLPLRLPTTKFGQKIIPLPRTTRKPAQDWSNNGL